MLKVSLVTTMMLLGGFAGDAAAAPLFWNLNALEQGPGLPAAGLPITGFFTYDPATGFSTDWNFQVTGMTAWSPFPPSCLGDCLISSSEFDASTHSVVYQTCFLAGGICYPTEIFTASSNFDGIVVSFSISGHQTSSVLHLDLAEPLTDAGGTIALIPAAPCMPGEPPVCDSSSPGSYIGQTFPASPFFLNPLTGSVTLAPEPESMLYVLLGVAVLAARRGRRFYGA